MRHSVQKVDLTDTNACGEMGLDGGERRVRGYLKEMRGRPKWD